MALDLLVGRTLGRYRLEAELGRGAMATVYLARDLDLDRDVAVKVLHAFYAEDEEFLGRFDREAKLAARLDHPNVVHVYAVGVEERLPWFAMSRIAGKPLDEILSARGRLPWGEAVPLLGGILEGVGYAHKHGIVHRDLKPANVMVTDEGKPVLTDFGIAKPVGTSRLTRTGASLGTVLYMAPEQFRGPAADVGPGADLYACGVILYQLLAGSPPFLGEDPMGIAYSHAHDRPPPLGLQVPDLPEGLETVVLKSLEKKARDRWESATAFQDALAAVLRGEPGKVTLSDFMAGRSEYLAPPTDPGIPIVVPPGGRARQPSPTWLAAAAAMGAGLLLLAQARFGTDPPPPGGNGPATLPPAATPGATPDATPASTPVPTALPSPPGDPGPPAATPTDPAATRPPASPGPATPSPVPATRPGRPDPPPAATLDPPPDPATGSPAASPEAFASPSGSSAAGIPDPTAPPPPPPVGSPAPSPAPPPPAPTAAVPSPSPTPGLPPPSLGSSPLTSSPKGRLEALLLAADLDATLELLGADPSLGSGLGAAGSRALVSMARTAFESGRPGHAVRLLQPMAGVADLGPEIPLLLARSYLSMTDGKSRDRAADPLAQAIRLQDASQVAAEAMTLVEASGKLSPQARLPVEKVLLEKAAELVARKARGQAESLLVPLSGRGGTVAAEAWVRIGELAEGFGDAKAACQAYKKGLDADSGWRSILSRKTMEDFARELDKRATTDALARVSATRLWRALRAFNDHGFEASMKELTQVVKHHPEARPALSRYYSEAGLRVLAQGRRNLVFPLAKGALDLDSRNPLAHKVLGDFYLGPDGAVEKALYHYRAALRGIGLAK